MLIHCVRHGESSYNAEGRIQGQSDPALSELGRRQGEAVAEALAQLPIDAVYSSPLRRAMQTARPLADALQLEVRTDDRLMEVHAGDFQDQLRTDLEALRPEEMARWRSGDPDFALPGGETRRHLMQRGLEVFQQIADNAHKQVVVVTHGGLLAAALKALLGVPARRHPFLLYNGSISRLRSTVGEVKLLSLNQVDHLNRVGFGGRGDL
ncbi:MAG: histidine phosphatase family protein [Candidatus Nealsonbacteria bacterium]|nr:histidine phosphatase family protein [Candidatus Nealsonbacteria bacterium]